MWQAPADELFELSEGDVHVWRWPLAESCDRIATLKKLLSADEVARAERFYFARHHDAFVAARAGLRKTLSRYLGAPPEAIEIAYGVAGKPELSGPLAADGPAFNLSHSGDWAVCAVGRRGPLGVDIELLRPLKNAAGLARRYFAPAEVAAWESLAELGEAELLAAFFRCWTRKEAYLKALGDGLRAPLDSFVVSLAPGEPPRLVRPSPRDGAADWSMEEIDVAAGYLAALVAPSGCRTTRLFTSE